MKDILGISPYFFQEEQIVLFMAKLYNNINVHIIIGGIKQKEVLILLDKIYTIDELRKMMCPIFKNHDIKKAVLFGSYGKGKATRKSDIDLLVDSNLHGLRFVGLVEDIRSTVNKDVDVFDITHVEPGSLIDDEIRETGIVLYEK